MSIKTQVRLSDDIYADLSDYIKKHNLNSMNSAINLLVNDGIMRDISSDENITPDILRHLIDEHMSGLSVPELKQVLNLVIRLDTLRNL